MRRAFILATLTCILFAVAGVTVARENSFTSSPASRSPRRVARNTANRESRASSPTLADPTLPERKRLTAIRTRSPFVTRTR